MTDEASSEVKAGLTSEASAKSAGETAVAFEDGMLDVGDGHAVYWRAQGPNDAPVMLIVHGGPGGAGDLDDIDRRHSQTTDRHARLVTAWGGPPVVFTGELHHSTVKVLRRSRERRRRRRRSLTGSS